MIGKGKGFTIEWTEADIAFLRANCDKMSSAELAKQLNTGHTRYAVIGKIHRLGLSGRPHGVRVTKPQRRKKPRVSNGRPTLKPTLADRMTRKDPTPYMEPPMPVLEGDQKLHSRSYADLDSGMCRWPVYQEQGVQMYCAAATERLPGRFASYCGCHTELSQIAPSERKRRYRGI